PGALVGVAASTILTTNLELPIARVDVPSSLVDSISFPAAGNFAQLVQPDIILMTLMISVIASAETLLSAAAVDRMHDGERTR
ncbi:SulP family inorganic anion transporter, partial [Rhizobium ruizarguesonis]